MDGMRFSTEKVLFTTDFFEWTNNETFLKISFFVCSKESQSYSF